MNNYGGGFLDNSNNGISNDTWRHNAYNTGTHPNQKNSANKNNNVSPNKVSH